MLIARFRNSEVGSDVMMYTDPLEISLHIHVYVYRRSNYCCFFSLLGSLHASASQPCRSCSCVVSCQSCFFMKLFYEQIKYEIGTVAPKFLTNDTFRSIVK